MMTKDELNLLYEAHVGKLYRFFYFKIQDKVIAEDLTSQTFLEFVKKAKNNSKIIDHTKYLYGIAKIVFLRHLKRKYIDQLFIKMDMGEFTDYVDRFTDEVEKHDTIEEYAIRFIERLPDKQKVVAKMRFIDKSDLNEICGALGKDMNYVKTTQKRAIQSLKKMISCTP
jgi:RNA polymerase sigma-70 factor (ECF subfamily)